MNMPSQWPFIVALLVACILAAPPARAGDEPRTTLTGHVEIARLVDLCAERLNLNIEYDAATLRGQVTLRLGAGVTDDELWMLTNRVLASRGFATVQMPGEELVSVVRLQDASGLARLERLPSLHQDDPVDEPATAPTAGYTTAVTRIEHQSPRRIVEAIKLILSRTGSQAMQIGESDLILISDLTPRVAEAQRLLTILDTPIDPPVIEKISTEYLAASQLAPLVAAAAQARDAITGRPKRGRVAPLPDGTALILTAPPEERTFWISIIREFDTREAVTMSSYSLRQFSVSEVARLIEQSVRTPGPRGSGEQWRLVQDELTGTLIITATPSEHEQIAALLERLEGVPTEARRPVRAFPIRNRSVREMVDILSRLADAGILESDLAPRAASRREDHTRPEGARWIGGIRPAPSEGVESPDEERSIADSTRITQRQLPRSTQQADRSLMLTADEGTNTIIAIGDPRKLAQLDQLIRRLDIRQPQVMLEVLILSLTESQTMDLGVELQKMEIRGSTMMRLASVFGLGPAGLVTMTQTPLPGQGLTGVVLSPGDFSVLLRALVTLNEGRSLTLPKVLVNNNQVATLDSVRQEPFTSLNALDTVATTSFGGTLDAGTVVTVTPQIAEADHLLLEYAVSISSFVGDSADPALPPPRQQDRLSSQVTIPDGYTVVVGGLELEREGRGVSQIPLLGSVPILGEAFKTRSRTKSRSRFFVFIRANVLRHEGFEDLQYLSERDLSESGIAGVAADWPIVEPRIIR